MAHPAEMTPSRRRDSSTPRGAPPADAVAPGPVRPLAITPHDLSDAPLSPEYRCLMACAAWASGAPEAAAELTALATRVDWPETVRLAAPHGLVAVLGHVLDELRLEHLLEPDALLALRRRRVAQVANYSSNKYTLAEVAANLRAAGIPFMPLKGVALAESLYPTPNLRRVSDIDLYVQPHHLEAACAALAQSGFAVDKPKKWAGFDYDIKLRRSAPVSMLLEVHWLLNDDAVYNNALSVLDSARVWQRSLPHPSIPGARRMAAEDELLYLAAHAMKHNWRALYVLMDLALYLRSQPIDWETLRQLARGLGSSWTLEASLILTSGLLRAPVPTHVAEILEEQFYSQRRLRELVRHVTAEWICQPYTAEERHHFSPWMRYLKIQGTAARNQRTRWGALRYWAGKLTAPDEKDLALLGTSETSWLYKVLRPLRLGALHLRYTAFRLRRKLAPAPTPA